MVKLACIRKCDDNHVSYGPFRLPVYKRTEAVYQVVHLLVKIISNVMINFVNKEITFVQFFFQSNI